MHPPKMMATTPVLRFASPPVAGYEFAVPVAINRVTGTLQTNDRPPLEVLPTVNGDYTLGQPIAPSHLGTLVTLNNQCYFIPNHRPT
jgi:hypothetical protein